MMKQTWMVLVAVVGAGLAGAARGQSSAHNHGAAADTAAQHAAHEHEGVGEARGKVLVTPEGMRVEHRHLHEQLAEALKAGGKTAEAAKGVEKALAPHFVEEEAYAMPPLSLLGAVAQGKPVSAEQAHAAVEMAEKLRANYGPMIREHQAITDALEKLGAAAKAENKAGPAAFAESLKLHARHEEEVLYPATLVLGEYLKLKMAHR